MRKQEQFQAVAARVAAVLRKERMRQELSMNAVGARAGLSQQMVSYVERGLRNPTLDTLLRLTHALGISLTEVLAAALREPRK